MPRTARVLVAALALATAAGATGTDAPDPAGPSLEDLDRQLYDTSRSLAPPHPVTGEPVLNPISEEWEIRMARDLWSKVRAAADLQGVPVDPPGPRLDRLRAVFDRLAAVTHRPDLPWEVHLLGLEKANAYTPGGGLVVVMQGLFGSLVAEDDDDELAAILAHEIAHVNLLHPPAGLVWRGIGLVVSEEARSAYYQAAYTVEQEEEADRLGVLYMALAGFDPAAAAEVWERADDVYGSREADFGFLQDHPLNEARSAANADAARQVADYRVPGRRNPEWQALLADNALFPPSQTAQDAYTPGSGVARAATALFGALARHTGVRREKERREEEARRFASVDIVRAWASEDDQGSPAIALEVRNEADRAVAGLDFEVRYGRDDEVLAVDESCSARVAIPPGATRRLDCPMQSIPGAARFVAEIVDIRWQ